MVIAGLLLACERGLPIAESPRGVYNPSLGTHEPAWDSRGPTSGRVVPDLCSCLLSWSCEIVRQREGSRRKTTDARFPWWVTIKQTIVIDRLSMESNLAQVIAGKMYATMSDPSGLGMMQPEGRPQQGKLKA